MTAVDPDGSLCGVPGTLCHIEVKATKGDGSNPFPMSSGEWEHALDCHRKDGHAYVIVRVVNANEQPTILPLIVDPVELERRGMLSRRAKSSWIRVAGPVGGGD